jgi:hypothetical protein
MVIAHLQGSVAQHARPDADAAAKTIIARFP